MSRQHDKNRSEYVRYSGNKPKNDRCSPYILALRTWFVRIWTWLTHTFVKSTQRKPGPFDRGPARKAGKARIKQPRLDWKFWWFKHVSEAKQSRAKHNLNRKSKQTSYHKLNGSFCAKCVSQIAKVIRDYACAVPSWSFCVVTFPMRVVVAWFSPKCLDHGPHFVDTRKPRAPNVGLNQLLRGGGRGAAKATERKRAETKEAELLQGLTMLLQSFSQSETLEKPKPKPNPKQKSSPKDKSQLENRTPAPTQTANFSHEQGLFQALERIVARAQKQPGTLMQRLTGLVQSAKKGNNLNQSRQARRRRKESEQGEEGNSSEPPNKRQRASGARSVPTSQAPATGMPRQQSSTAHRAGPTEKQPTWADIAKNKAKSLSADKPKWPPSKKNWPLLKSAWPEGALVPVQKVQEALEQGMKPTGAACICQTLNQAQDLQRLTKLHQLADVKFALLLAHQDDVPLGSQTLHFPTQESGKPGLRPFSVMPLSQALPSLPSQKLKTTSVSAEKTPLATFRISIPKDLFSKVQWEGIKNNPQAHIHNVFNEQIVHSTYGWREAEISAKRQEKPDILLQGFLRAKDNYVEAVMKKSGQEGLFVDRLSTQQQPRPNLWWIQRLEDEEPVAYYQRALQEAKNDGVTLAFRKGGGAFLGLRLKANQQKPQLHAWTLHGAPKHWGGQEVLKCLLDAGCLEVAIIRPPGRQRSWLLKAVVPDENAIGVLGIQAGSNMLYLNRVQHKVKRSEEVVQVIRPHFKTKVGQTQKKEEKPAKHSEREATANQTATNEDKARSRSPNGRGRNEVNPLLAELQNKYDVRDCGGLGNCGYNCLAAALGLDKGEDFDAISTSLTARGRTVRNDLYKHMTKHSQEYSAWFTKDTQATEEHEAGPIPATWTEYLEATLRDGRWIDGLSWQAASKRYGLHIIVIPLDGAEKDRPMSFGSPRSGREPVVLLLQSGHYQLAQRKAGKQWPKAWTSAENAKLDSAVFRGGGKSCASSVISVHSWRTQRTPESRHSWRPCATPSASSRTKTQPSKSKASAIKNSTAPSLSNIPAKRKCIKTKPRHDKATVTETFVWTCNLCEQCFRYTNKRSLACARLRHVQSVHPGQADSVHACFPRRNSTPAEASQCIPADQRAWSCPKCKCGLGYMPKHVLKKSRDHHVMKCFGLSSQELRKLRYKSPIWKDHHERLVKKNATNKLNLNNAAIAAYNDQTQAKAFRIPRQFTSSAFDEFSCGKCTLVFQRLNALLEHNCRGMTGRQAILNNAQRRKFWQGQRRKKDQEAISFLVKQWKLTKSELDLLEVKLYTQDKYRTAPPPTSCSWFRDLTEEGVEPHPGPCNSLQLCAVNVNGRENTWALARTVIAERPAVVIVQEHCMLPTKQTDLARFLDKHGYRSWWVVQPAAQNAIGQSYTSGGVAIWVRKDKAAREISRHIAPDGQALMLQMDHMYIIGAYLPPRRIEATDTLAMLDEWVCSLGSQDPTFIVADFNAEPELAARWTHLTGGGATKTVTNDLGEAMPTRWNGRRCIDWVWASHPNMIRSMKFSDLIIADHRVLEFRLLYDQHFVRTFQQLPTRCLQPPQQVAKNHWDAAIEKAWEGETTPASSTTEQEWMDFCALIEKTYDKALAYCGADPLDSRLSIRGKGSDISVKQVQPKTFRLKQHASCRELKLRKLLGRTREAIRQQQQGHQVPQVVWNRICQHPLVQSQGLHSLKEIEFWTEAEVKHLVKQDRLNKLQEWRDRMRTNTKDAGQWVKRSNTLPVTSVHETTYKEGAATSSNQESLEAIVQYWETIWNRERPPVEEAFAFWSQGLPARPPLAWTQPTAQELYSQALRLKGSAAGPDGLSGTEIAQLPLKTWEIFSDLLLRWTNRSELPEVWSSTRQVHLQKPGAALRSDGAISAKDMRPISIQSVIWRTVASAWTRRQSTRTWIKSWAHPTACGGLQGTGVAQAVDILYQAFEKGGVLLSLDYQKCFDSVDPTLGLQCLQHMGCPQTLLYMLQHVWRQKRWLTYNGEFLPQAVDVHSSLPQGDAISPLTLLALMSGLTRLVLQQEHPRIPLVTYLDDRNMVAQNPAHAARLWTTWKQMSARVGLWENETKTRVVPRRAAFKNLLLEEGFQAHHIADATRVLGIDFTAKFGATNRKTQDERLNGAKARLSRVDLLPVAMQVKASLVASLVIPKAAWGSWTSLRPTCPLTSMVRRIAGSRHGQTSNELFYILAGHGLNAVFCAGMQTYMYLATEVRQRPRRWPPRSSRGTWLYTVRSWMQSLGWTEEAPWTWHHPDLGAPMHRISWNGRLRENESHAEKHALRESWRRTLFSSFLKSTRRDAAAVAGTEYDEQRVSLARNMFRTQETHARAIMTGAVVSDARCDVINHRPIDTCTWCNQNEIPCWDHLAWSCEGFASTRPPVPGDALQRVLGWPVGHHSDQVVLTHLSRVRSKLLDKRYRGVI